MTTAHAASSMSMLVRAIHQRYTTLGVDRSTGERFIEACRRSCPAPAASSHSPATPTYVAAVSGRREVGAPSRLGVGCPTVAERVQELDVAADSSSAEVATMALASVANGVDPQSACAVASRCSSSRSATPKRLSIFVRELDEWRCKSSANAVRRRTSSNSSAARLSLFRSRRLAASCSRRAVSDGHLRGRPSTSLRELVHPGHRSTRRIVAHFRALVMPGCDRRSAATKHPSERADGRPRATRGRRVSVRKDRPANGHPMQNQ